VNHENANLDSPQCRADRHPGIDSHARIVSRTPTDAQAAGCESARHGGAGRALAVGTVFVAASDGEEIRLTQVTTDFIHWIYPTNGSTGRMLRCHFLNFFTPLSQ